MTRRVVWSLTVLLVLATAAGAWFISAFEPVAVPRRAQPSAQARRDPYLALERFLERMGRPLTRSADPQALDRLAPTEAVILASGRRVHLTPERRDRLFAWVAAGGYLVVVPERNDRTDAVIEPLDLEWRESWLNTWTDEDEPEAVPVPKMPETIEVAIPEARTLRAAFVPGMIVGDRQPEWTAGDPRFGARLVHFSHGHGAITVVANLEQLASNTAIGLHDHAEILWTLLNRYQPQGPVTLVSHLHVPTLFEWLREHALAPLTSLAIVVALWLWRIVPRSGPLAPDVPPARRELREHLRAVGFFMWRSGTLETGTRSKAPQAFVAKMQDLQRAGHRARRHV